MTVKDLRCEDIVELFWQRDFTYVLTDEFDVDTKHNTFVKDEDDSYTSFDCITKIWREDENGNYILIYKKDKFQDKGVDLR